MPYEPPAVYLKGMPKGMAPRLTLQEYLAIRLRRRDPGPAEREWIRQLYQAEVRWVDAAVGSLIAELKRSGRYEDTLIVLLSDHGEEFWEHGGIGHGHTLYEELLRVPWLVKLPGESRRGGINTPVSTASLAATILDLAGKPFPARYPAARSLSPLLRGSEAVSPEPLLSSGLQRLEEREAILFDGFKLIRWETSGRQELYDLALDPAETTDLAASTPEKTAEGARLLDRLDAESERDRKSLGIRREHAPIDPEAMKRLRALGYGR
jgi:arylsulfatase A-like enzyme